LVDVGAVVEEVFDSIVVSRIYGAAKNRRRTAVDGVDVRAPS
jgi:hypothetical protein